MSKGHCHVVGPDCTAPAGFRGGHSGLVECPAQPVVKCYKCGQDVCKGCSTLREYQTLGAYRKVRICDDCSEEMNQL